MCVGRRFFFELANHMHMQDPLLFSDYLFLYPTFFILYCIVFINICSFLISVVPSIPKEVNAKDNPVESPRCGNFIYFYWFIIFLLKLNLLLQFVIVCGTFVLVLDIKAYNYCFFSHILFLVQVHKKCCMVHTRSLPLLHK